MTIQSSSSSQAESLIYDFLATHHSGTLATADGAGNPHAAVVYYAVERDFGLTFATKTETQKYKNIEENKQVAFAVYDEEAQTVVQIMGHAELITEEHKRQKVLDNMIHQSLELSHKVLPPAEKLVAGGYVALRVVPQVIKMAVYVRTESEGDDDIYERLLFSEG